MISSIHKMDVFLPMLGIFGDQHRAWVEIGLVILPSHIGGVFYLHQFSCLVFLTMDPKLQPVLFDLDLRQFYIREVSCPRV